MKHSARCDCYNDHPSASGRCNCRHVDDPTATQPDDAVFCERCRRECVERVVAERPVAADCVIPKPGGKENPMKLRIEIDMDNAAFEGANGREAARILRQFADSIEDRDLSGEIRAINRLLSDSNGNACGIAVTE